MGLVEPSPDLYESAARAASSGHEDAMCEGDIHHWNVLVSNLSAGQDQREAFNALKREFKKLAFDCVGCRTAQIALEKVPHYMQLELASELRWHVLKAAKCIHANYVLQKIVEQLQTSNLGFIVEELTGFARDVAQDRCGVRILCRVLEHYPQDVCGKLITEAMQDLGELCRHRYGNYLVSHILDHGTLQQQKRVLKTLAGDPFTYSRHSHANALIRSALLLTNHEERNELLKNLLGEPKFLAETAITRHGSRVVKSLLDKTFLSEKEVNETRSILSCEESLGILKKKKFGTKFLQELG